jgi:hypothetical protein
MTPRAILVGLAAAAGLTALSARAEQDPLVAQIRTLHKTPQQMPAAAVSAASIVGQVPPGKYKTADAAAVGFVDLVRTIPEQRNEYCAYILFEKSDRSYGLSAVRQGDFNQCPADRPKPANAVASVHTHPKWGGDDVASAAGQVFSEGDFQFADSDEMKFPIYLGAPAGHILRYDNGGTTCQGDTLVKRKFVFVRDAPVSVRGRLAINSGDLTTLYDQAGKKQPKPPQCH